MVKLKEGQGKDFIAKMQFFVNKLKIRLTTKQMYSNMKISSE